MCAEPPVFRRMEQALMFMCTVVGRRAFGRQALSSQRPAYLAAPIPAIHRVAIQQAESTQSSVTVHCSTQANGSTSRAASHQWASKGAYLAHSAPRRAVMAHASASIGAPGPQDLVVVGPGVLGSYAGKLWIEAHPGARVIGVTNTNNNHARLSKMGLQPSLKADLPAGVKYPYVLFAAPPSGSNDYPAEVAAALDMWDSSAPNASFVFTGSMGVCSVDDGSTVVEDCPLSPMGSSPSTDRLLNAEQLVFKAGGNVVRLVGLYHAQRGAHTYFLKIKDVPRPGDYVVNLLHYEDAARLAVSVLGGEGSGPFRGQVFLGCDNHPVTFKAMMDACLHSPIFAGQQPVNFTVPDQGPNKSKRADNTATRQRLGGWKPKYGSFESFMVENGGKDFYTTSGLF